MSFKRNSRTIKHKVTIYILVFVSMLIIGGVCGAGLCWGQNYLKEEANNENSYERKQSNQGRHAIDVRSENITELQAGIIFKESDLNVLLSEIHKAYIFNQWFLVDTFGIPNNYAEDRITFKPEDLESVIFYINDEGKLFFIPVSMVNKIVHLEDKEIKVCEYHDEDRINLYLYSYEVLEREMERAIYPEPDKRVIIIREEVQDCLDKIQVLGTAYVSFPEKVPDGAAKLYENEYTDAIVDIIHSYFYEMKMYGEYQIYFGVFQYRPDWDEGYKILIDVAIVGKETSYWWIFRAKDVLAEDGRVILDSDGGQQHTYPAEYDKATYNYYAPEIDGIIHANRLVIPLTVQEGDIVKRLGVFKDEDDINTLHYYLE